MNDINEIRKRLLDICHRIATDSPYLLAGFLVTEARQNVSGTQTQDAKDCADFLLSDYANGKIRAKFLDEFNDYVMDNGRELRVCDNCGGFMTEGYYLGGEYACCDDCAVELYDGDENQLRRDLEADEESGAGECYYTEW